MGSTFSIINDTGKPIWVYHEVPDSFLQNTSWILKATPIALDAVGLLTNDSQTKKQLDNVGRISRACGNLTQEYQRKRVDDLTAFKCILPYGKYTVKQTPMSELCVKISFEENKILSKIRKTSEKIHYASDWLPEPIQNAHPSNISKLKKFIQRKYAILRSEVPLHILVITSVTLLTVVLYYCTL